MIDPRLIDVVLPEHDGYPPELAAQDGASLTVQAKLVADSADQR